MTESAVVPSARGRSLVAALCLSGGMVVADLIGPSPVLASVLGFGGVLLMAGAWWAHGRRQGQGEDGLVPPLRWPAAALVVLGLAAAGVAVLGARAGAAMRAGHGLPAGEALRFEGVVADDPVSLGSTTRFTLRALSVEGTSSRIRLAMRVFGRDPRLRLGDRVSLRATVAPLDPGSSFDTGLRRRWIVARGTATSAAVRRRGPSTNPFVRAAGVFRERMRRAAQRALPGADGNLVLGLTIGDDTGLPDRVREDFRAAGLSHLTAVSGENVAAVVGATFAVLAALRVPRRVQVGVAAVTIGLFAIVTRWEPSVLRATVMAALVLGAFVFGRRADALHGLGLAMIVLLAFDPYLLWRVGFQLSCAATVGILLLGPPITAHLGRWPRSLAQGAAVTVAAQVAVLPLLVVSFGQLSLVSLPANLVALPLVPPAMLLGLAGGLVALLSPAAAGLLVRVAGVPAGTLRRLAHWFASVPHATIPVSLLGLLLASLACGVLGVAWMRHRAAAAGAEDPARRPGAGTVPNAGSGSGADSGADVGGVTDVGSRPAGGPRAGEVSRLRMRPAVVLMVVAVAAGVAGQLLFRRAHPPRGMRTTFFDVGQGEAALVQSPGGTNLLVDGGPDPEAVVSHLVRRGVRRLDLVVFSHGHADHVAGLPAVLRRIPVQAVIAPLAGGRFTRGLPPGMVLTASGEGDRIRAGDLVVDILGPGAGLRDAAGVAGASPDGGEGSPVNNASLVLRVSWGRGCELFTGDVEEEAQQALIDRHRSAIGCTLLKAPHHGSARLLPAFVQAVDPEWVAVSVGRNTFGHPSLAALAMFDYVGATVLRTDRVGDVVLEMDEAGKVRALP